MKALRLAAWAVVVAGVAVRSAAAFGLTKLSAAFLGPEQFARYGHFVMLASYLLTISSLGLGNAFTVHIARRGGPADAGSASQARDRSAVVLMGAATGTLTAVLLAATVATGWTGSFLPRISWAQLPIWLLFSIGSGAGNAFLAAVLGQQRHCSYQGMAAAMPLLSCVALVASVSLEPLNAERAIACYMLGYLVPAAVYLARGPSFRSVDWDSIRVLVRFALPYVVPSLLTPTIGTIGILSVRRVIAGNVSVHDLGLWQALWRVSESYMGVLIAIGSVLFVPRVSKASTRDEARREIRWAVLLSVTLYLPIAAAWLIAPRLALGVLLAPSFVGIASLLPIQVAGDVLKVVCTALVLSHTALLRPGIALLAEVLFSASFIGMAVLLTPRAGVPGAVGAYVSAYAVLVLALVLLVRKTIHALPLEDPGSVPAVAAAGLTAEASVAAQAGDAHVNR